MKEVFFLYVIAERQITVHAVRIVVASYISAEAHILIAVPDSQQLRVIEPPEAPGRHGLTPAAGVAGKAPPEKITGMHGARGGYEDRARLYELARSLAARAHRRQAELYAGAARGVLRGGEGGDAPSLSSASARKAARR